MCVYVACGNLGWRATGDTIVVIVTTNVVDGGRLRNSIGAQTRANEHALETLEQAQHLLEKIAQDKVRAESDRDDMKSELLTLSKNVSNRDQERCEVRKSICMYVYVRARAQTSLQSLAGMHACSFAKLKKRRLGCGRRLRIRWQGYARATNKTSECTSTDSTDCQTT